jgi:hypothetical protein
MLILHLSAMRDNSIEDKQFARDAGGQQSNSSLDWLLGRHCCLLKSGFCVRPDASKRRWSWMICFNRPQGIDAASISLIPDQ